MVIRARGKRVNWMLLMWWELFHESILKFLIFLFQDNVDSGTPKKFHHQNAPEYLERRQRLRKKSGNILSDILKPPRARKNNKRTESESPRTVCSRENNSEHKKILERDQSYWKCWVFFVYLVSNREEEVCWYTARYEW